MPLLFRFAVSVLGVSIVKALSVYLKMRFILLECSRPIHLFQFRDGLAIEWMEVDKRHKVSFGRNCCLELGSFESVTESCNPNFLLWVNLGLPGSWIWEARQMLYLFWSDAIWYVVGYWTKWLHSHSLSSASHITCVHSDEEELRVWRKKARLG